MKFKKYTVNFVPTYAFFQLIRDAHLITILRVTTSQQAWSVLQINAFRLALLPNLSPWQQHRWLYFDKQTISTRPLTQRIIYQILQVLHISLSLKNAIQ